MVHEHAGELLPHRLGQQGRAHGGVHAAGEGQQDLAAAHLLPDVGDGGALIVVHRPVACRAAHLIEEIADHSHTVLRVVDLGMVLHAVEAPLLIRDGHVGAVVRVGHQGKALRHLLHIIPVAHPGDAPLGKAVEELAGRVIVGLRLAVLAGRVLLRGGHPPSQGMGHELTAVADPQYRHPQRKDAWVHLGRLFLIDRVRAAGKNEADGPLCLELFQRRGVGLYLAVHAALTDTAGNELIVLAAEIQYDDKLMGHTHFPFWI